MSLKSYYIILFCNYIFKYYNNILYYFFNSDKNKKKFESFLRYI